MEEESEEVTSASASPRRGRSSSASSASPEFEFWMVGTNPSSFPPPHLLSADELFADGLLLPLHLLHPNNLPQPQPAAADIAAPPTSGSKRWRDIFRVPAGDKRPDDKERRRDRKTGSAAAAADIGINIWPFARSRSAGNAAAARSRAAAPAPGRKASSAPCSRSNSRGESGSSSSSSAAAAAGPPRRWAASPGRAGGVHVGRSSPVWQIRRAGKGPEPRDKVPAAGRRAGAGAGARVLRLNVNTCIGYRSHVSCRGDAGDNKKSGGDGTAEEASGGGNGSGGGSLFNLRNLFSSKKVY